MFITQRQRHILSSLRLAEGDGGDGGGSGAGGNGGTGGQGDDGNGAGGKDGGDRGDGAGKGERLPQTQEELDRILQARLARDRKDRLSDDEIAELRRKAERAEELERERMSDQEKAVEAARKEAAEEAERKAREALLPQLQTANLRAAAAEVLSGDRLDNWLKTVNVSAFVDEQGTVNTDEVMGTLTALFGDSGGDGGSRNNGGHRDWGHSRGNGGGVAGGVQAGRELFKSRHK